MSGLFDATSIILSGNIVKTVLNGFVPDLHERRIQIRAILVSKYLLDSSKTIIVNRKSNYNYYLLRGRKLRFMLHT